MLYAGADGSVFVMGRPSCVNPTGWGGETKEGDNLEGQRGCLGNAVHDRLKRPTSFWKRKNHAASSISTVCAKLCSSNLIVHPSTSPYI